MTRDAGTLAYVWPTLMAATFLATFVSVALMAWRDRHRAECDARHTGMGYSAARHVPSMYPSPTATSAATGAHETE